MALADQIKDAVFRYIMGTEIQNSTAIASYFAGGATVVAYLDGNEENLVVKTSPIISISAIFDVSQSATITATTYDFYSAAGCIYKDNGNAWGVGKRRWKTTYLAGYSAIPQDIQLAIDKWVAYATADSTGALKSYKTGDDSETYFDIGDMPSQIKALLGKFKRRLF